MTRISKLLVPVAMAFGLFVVATPAHASLIIAAGNNPQVDENVLLNTGLTGDPVFGTTNQTGFSVMFDSNELMAAPSNGQARVEGVDGALTQLSISLPGGTFTSLILNVDVASDGFLNFTATPNVGSPLIALFAVGSSGSNFFTVTADNGQRLTDVSFTSNVDVTDVAQVRIGGAAADAATIPEPASLLLLGMGFVGAGVRRRLQRSA